MSKENLTNIIGNLLDKYQDNSVMLNKVIQHIEQLPEYFENTNTNIIKREERKHKLEKGSVSFINKFLNKYKYYYNHTNSNEHETGLFFEYTNNHFKIIKEDDIQHKILSSINEHKELFDWKHKIKVSILKKIKERNIFSCIPESETIQNVINILCPLIFDNKESCKYFLTVIGDILLKKSNLIYFTNPKIKQILQELNTLSFKHFGTQSIFNVFKFKFYDHTFSNCRLIDTNDFLNNDTMLHYLKTVSSIDIFCVAAHYSQRYESADNYLLNNCSNDRVIKHAFYLTNCNEKDIINNFCDSTIENSDDCNISWKNMQYLWKLFIEEQRIPNVLFTTAFKTLLIDKYDYDSEKDLFLDCTSKYLPNVGKFIKFWNDNIESCDDDYMYDELEIDEVASLCYNYSKININEKNILDLIKHFYPDILIEDNKYIVNVKCKLWNKRGDIIDSLKKYKSHNNIDELYDEIHINELYNAYCKSKNKFIVSKKYFENFIKEESVLYTNEDNLIKVKSFDNLI